MVWTKGGAPIDTSRVHVHTSDLDTVFFVRQAARPDSGEYELSVQIENMKDTATIHIRVVGARPAGREGMEEAAMRGEGRRWEEMRRTQDRGKWRDWSRGGCEVAVGQKGRKAEWEKA